MRQHLLRSLLSGTTELLCLAHRLTAANWSSLSAIWVKASIDGLGPGSRPPLNLSMRWLWEQMLLAPANAKTFKW